MFFLSYLKIDQNCQKIDNENKIYNFLFHFTKFNSIIAKNVKIWSWKINFDIAVLCGQKQSKYGQNILNFLFYVVQYFVARWYYKNSKTS